MTDLLLLAVNAALEAGKSIMTIYNDPASDFQVERKSDCSPLTIADKASNDVINQYLVDTKIPILSEEGKILDYANRSSWHVLWIVDPLDGTKEFIKKNGEFTVNIALVKNQKPILGVVYLPVKNTLYFSLEGKGAYVLNNIEPGSTFNYYERLLGNADKLPRIKQDKDKAVVVASRSHMSEETAAYIDKLKTNYTEVELVSVGSSIKICWVAEGVADVYPRFAPTMEWDTAAGHAVALEAGKQIYHTDEKNPLVYNKEDLLNPWFIVK